MRRIGATSMQPVGTGASGSARLPMRLFGDAKLSHDRLGEPSSAIRAEVERARELQRRRFNENREPRAENREPGYRSRVTNHGSRITHLQRGHAGGGDTANLQAGWSRGEPSAGGNGTDEPFRARASPDAEVGADDCGFGGMRPDTGAASGGGAAIQAEDTLAISSQLSAASRAEGDLEIDGGRGRRPAPSEMVIFQKLLRHF
jgi:hypothetical protein